MTITSIDESQRKAARVAGLAGLLAMAAVVFQNYAIHERLIVAGNAAETARNIIAHERLFRIAIASDLFYVAGVVVLLTALYTVLKPVSRSLALLAAFFRLVYVMMWVVMALNHLDALRLLNGADYLSVFEPDRLQALARLRLSADFDAYYVGLPFYGLASTVCSYLWIKSNYIPRTLAAWGVISSAWCAACAFAFIIFPDFILPGLTRTVTLFLFDSPMGAFEIVTSLWLLFKGVRPSGSPRVEAPLIAA